MRRKDREVTDFEEIKQIISECGTIRLGLSDENCPYIVPLSFGYEIVDKQIYFYIHGATAGRKYELMKKNKVCSFEMDCAHKTEIIYDKKDVTMRYKCFMGTAEIAFLEDCEKEKAMDIMLKSYVKDENFSYNKNVLNRTMMAKLTVTSYTAKINPIGGNAD